MKKTNNSTSLESTNQESVVIDLQLYQRPQLQKLGKVGQVTLNHSPDHAGASGDDFFFDFTIP